MALVRALFIIILVLCLAYFFTRYVLGRMPMGNLKPRVRRMNMIEQLPVGRNQKLILVQMDDEVYFLGVSEDSINCINRIGPDQVKRWSEEDEILRMTQTRMGFQEAMGKVLGHEKKGEEKKHEP